MLLSGFEQKEGGTSVRTDPGGLARSVSVRSCTGAGFLLFPFSLVGQRPAHVCARGGVLGEEARKMASWASKPRPKTKSEQLPHQVSDRLGDDG